MPGNKHKASSPVAEVKIVEAPTPKPSALKKRKAPSHEVEIVKSPAPQPALKRRKVAKQASQQKVKSKEFVIDDEEDVPADKVIHVKVSSGVFLHVLCY
jgi:hypothetical protein